ncbi:hypothetical protein C8Q75DRAFT_895578 [Abortiporus biennis]|nr:hypothetical protein C8Q75DRAFT_895578 [Abortiporus biennis]
MYQRLSEAFSARRGNRIVEGIVLTGQSGIGKSFFTVYAALRRMTEAQPVLFTTWTGTSYLFNEDGAYVMKDKLDISDLPSMDPFIPTSRAWSLISEMNSAEAIAVVKLSRVFWVIAAPLPLEPWYDRLRKISIVLIWVMNPWSIADVHSLLSTQTATYDTLEKVSDLVEEIGFSLRDILEFIQYQQRKQYRNIPIILSTQSILEQFKNFVNPLSSNDEALLPFLLVRRKISPGGNLKNDSAIVHLRSRSIVASLMEELSLVKRTLDDGESFVHVIEQCDSSSRLGQDEII